MKKYVIFAAVILTLFFMPKDMGRPLCGGKICGKSDSSPHHYLRSCFGFRTVEKIPSSYQVTCYGFVGKKKCYTHVYEGDLIVNVEEVGCLDKVKREASIK